MVGAKGCASYSRDKRYCYWQSWEMLVPEGYIFPVLVRFWNVRDRVTKKRVECRTREEARAWIRAARRRGR
jgi:hypothetical protein